MNLSFITPEIFNAIILANLIIGVVLIIGRFTRDMTRQPNRSQPPPLTDITVPYPPPAHLPEKPTQRS